MNRQFHKRYSHGFSRRGVRFPSNLDKHRGKDLIPVRAVSFHNCGVIEFLLGRRGRVASRVRTWKRGKNKA